MTHPVVTTHPVVDAVIDRHDAELGSDRKTYRHHVLRCVNYHALLTGQPVEDDVALAWAVHDLGIWTADTFDYLDPSADLADGMAADFGIESTARARRLVLDHHKLRSLADPEAEAFRQADLVDVSHGLLRAGIPRSEVRAVVDALPYLGFHGFLARGMTRHAAKHPSRPLPMVRW